MDPSISKVVEEGLWQLVAAFEGSADAFNAPFSAASADPKLEARYASRSFERISVSSIDLAALTKIESELHRYLADRGVEGEGRTALEQLCHLQQLVRALRSDVVGRAVAVLEVGFNEGHSACAILAARHDVSLVSFDIGEHTSVAAAKAFVDARFPGRHTLIVGDSITTVPAHEQVLRCRAAAEASSGSAAAVAFFELCFIDGGHALEVARADLRNCARLAARVVMDDLCPAVYWGRGPSEAWAEAIDDGRIVAEELYECSIAAGEEPRRAWGVGTFAPKTRFRER